MPELLYRTTHGQMEHLANKTYLKQNKTNYNNVINVNFTFHKMFSWIHG